MNSARFTRLLLLVVLVLAVSSASFAAVVISVTVAPPPIPVYVQPVCPTPGYMWTPGYWAWGPLGYYWVPGTWVPAPGVGLLWTPGYWGWSGGVYLWNGGYWGPHVGFYGGVNYGYGYGGVGFVGGQWRGGSFYYNSAVMHVNRNVTNVYVNRTVVVNNNNRVSYNGGTGGINRRPTQAEQAATRDRHVQPTTWQTKNQNAASQNPQFLAKNNGGKPAVAATAKPGDFSSRNVVPAKAAGGRVDASTLNATPKTMPAAPKNTGNFGSTGNSRPATGGSTATGTASPRPAVTTPANRNEPSTGTSNRPSSTAAPATRPSSSYNSTTRPSSSASQPRPSSSYNSSPKPSGSTHSSSAPQQRSAPPQQRSAPPQQHSAPQQRSAPPQQHSAPQQHNSAPQSKEKR